MGWLDAVFTGVGFVVKGVNHIAGGVAFGLGTGLQIVGETVKKWGQDLLSALEQDSHSSTIANSQSQFHKIREDLETIDIEFIEIENKQKKDGKITKADSEKAKELAYLRQQKFLALQETKKVASAIEHSQSPDEYESTFLDNEKVHILQYQMGQIVLEKRCPNSGKPMVLQSKQKLDGSLYSLNDFFWSCVGYYNDNHKCKTTQSFQQNDAGLLYKATIPELQIPNSDLNLIYSSKTVQNSVTKRMREHKGDRDEEILCPIHHVPMVLREKKEHLGVALDIYFLGCPHPSCGQTIKLKSAAQLAAFLRRKEGQGIV